MHTTATTLRSNAAVINFAAAGNAQRSRLADLIATFHAAVALTEKRAPIEDKLCSAHKEHRKLPQVLGGTAKPQKITIEGRDEIQIEGGDWFYSYRQEIEQAEARKLQDAKPHSALNFIRADVQPLGDYPDLLDKLCHLSEENNVDAVVALYDAYAAMANGILLLQNQPRAKDVDDFLELETTQAWSKAYMTADFLEDMRPNEGQAKAHARVLFDCALQMGGNLAHAVAIAKELGATSPTA